jgi:putative ABC transport system ATP-binding protein
MSFVIETEDITKIYKMGQVQVHALRGVSLKVHQGEMLAIMGSSGSGKSTLMNVLGCLDDATSGRYTLEGMDVSALTKNQYADIRNKRIGFVFQVFNLLPRTSALENVELPLFYDRTERIKDPLKRSREALERVGLGDRLDHEPNQLSGGERQRVAIARALVNKPSILLADEPTGNLDTRTSIDVMTVFQVLNDQGMTIILVTHELDIATYATRVVTLRDGLIKQDSAVEGRRDARRDLINLEDEARESGDIMGRNGERIFSAGNGLRASCASRQTGVFE